MENQYIRSREVVSYSDETLGKHHLPAIPADCRPKAELARCRQRSVALAVRAIARRCDALPKHATAALHFLIMSQLIQGPIFDSTGDKQIPETKRASPHERGGR